MVHDPTVKKWRIKHIINFLDGHLTLDTIKISSGNYYSVLLHTDSIGRLLDLGIKAIKNHSDNIDAIDWHNKAVFVINEIARSNTMADGYNKLIADKFMDKNDGPSDVSFDEVKDGNTIVGRDSELFK